MLRFTSKNPCTMKKLLLSLTIIAASFAGAVAQNPDDVSFGPRVGLNLSNIAYGSHKDAKDATDNLNPGGIIGLAINIPFGEIMSIQPEFLFAQKGIRFTVKDGLAKDTYWAYVDNYVEIPVLVKARLGGKFYGFLNGGGYTGVWLNRIDKSQIVLNGNKGDVNKKKIELKDDGAQKDNRFDAGIAFGTGFGFGAGSGHIELDFRYNMGFVDKIKYENGRPDGVKKLMNRNFGISAMFLF